MQPLPVQTNKKTQGLVVGILSSMSTQTAETMAGAILSHDACILAVAPTLHYQGNNSLMLQMKSNRFDVDMLRSEPERLKKVVHRMQCIYCQHDELKGYSAEPHLKLLWL